MTLKQYLDQELPTLEEELKRQVSHRGIYESRVWEAMDYSLMAGGKRIRPLMLQLSAWAVRGGGLEACTRKAVSYTHLLRAGRSWKKAESGL